MNQIYNIIVMNQHRYVQYGGLGMVLGHELTHGFDNTGKSNNDLLKRRLLCVFMV